MYFSIRAIAFRKIDLTGVGNYFVMKKMNCIIVDDDLVSQKAIEGVIKKTDFLNLVDTFSDPVAASVYLQKGGIDLIFLDIEMPGLSGFELLDTIDFRPQIILVSGKKDYAMEAFEYSVADYLVKPIQDYPRFLKAVLKAKENYERELQSQDDIQKGIFIKIDSLLVHFSLEDIVYIEAFGDYVKIHTPDKVYTAYATMKNVEKRLPAGEFMRIHRSFIVRLDQIQNIDSTTLQIMNHILPISGTYRADLLQKINTL